MKKNQKGGSSQSIIIVVMILFLIALLYGVYLYMNNYSISGKKTKILIPGIHDAKTPMRINEGSVPMSSQGNEYSLNFWLYINDYVYRYEQEKVIIKRGDSYNNISNPTILLTPNTNNLKIIINVKKNLNGNNDANGDSLQSVCEIEDIQLQRWVNISISLNNKTLDVFVNGHLVKTHIINGYPEPNIGALNICKDGGFNGFLSKLSFTNSALSITEIQSIYKNGPDI